MTIADILCCHCMSWAHNAKFPMNDETMLAYSSGLRKRPAYKRMAALSAPT